MMTGATDTVVRHRIGRDGLLSLAIQDGDLRLRGVDGDEVRIRPMHGEGPLDHLAVERGDGSLSIRPIGGGSARNAAGTDLDIELPMGATIVLDGASGDVTVDGLVGDQRYRSASGDLLLRSTAGRITAEAMSGDIEISATEPLALDVRTVSGDLIIRAARVHRLLAATTSGDLDVTASMTGDGPFSLETVSGDVSLAPGSDARITIRTITGDVLGGTDAQVEERDGARVVTIGAGTTAIAVRSTSGDIGIVGRSGTALPGAGAARPGPQAMPGPQATPPVVTGPDDTDVDGPIGEDDALAILQALERGDIDVAAARRRLDRLDVEDPTDV